MSEVAPGGKRAIPALTGVRGLGAVLVMIAHLPAFTVDLHGPPLSRLIARSYLWVDLFFVLSGFILCHVHAADFARRPTVATYLRFMHKRVARVYPLSVVTTLMAFALYWSWRDFWAALVFNLALLQSWAVTTAVIDPPSWSLSTEFVAYALFPLGVLAAISSRPAIAVLVFAAAAAVLIRLTVIAIPALWWRHGALDLTGSGSTTILQRCLAGFVVGMLAWRLSQVPRIVALLANGVAPTLAMIAMFASLASDVPDSMIVFAVIPILLMTLAHGRGPVTALLACPPMHALGLWSFSIYLIHEPIGLLPQLSGLKTWFAHLLGAHQERAGNVLIWAIVIAIAPLFYDVIEVAGGRLVLHGSWARRKANARP